ncbi:MAG: 4Fe-4S binding protein [Bosea sp.]|jgi:ferredoxin|nr:4Fe-4S binding protein [Bosea sp. (in: a-proteobacteria)]
MAEPTRIVAVCSCEDTMPLDVAAIAKGCGDASLKTARHLCRSQVDSFKAMLSSGASEITVACTQEAPLLAEIAEDLAFPGEVRFTNIRELAGWSDQARDAGPKMAALLAASAEPMAPTRFATLSSAGVALIYGSDDTAIEVARRLSDSLDVTVILTRPGDITPPRVADFPVFRGTVAGATGWLGAFELTIDDFAAAAPSSRARLAFGETRNGAKSSCDLVIDVSGGRPLFTGDHLREGYLRADPRDRAAIEALTARAATLVGEFDKPAYVNLEQGLCAHSRSRKTGCTRCLELCPAGAITSMGDHVAVSAEICAGCGACASVCPTGAITYALPPSDVVLRKLRTLITTHVEAGGRPPVLLVHDGDHGEPLIEALARFGRGLPAHVLPLRLNEVTQAGLELSAAALAFGAAAVRFLVRGKAKHDLSGLARNIDYANTLGAALGYGEGRAGLIETDDPDALRQALDLPSPGMPSPNPARFRPMGQGRQLLKTTIGELHRAAPAPVEAVAMPARAPFGGLEINVDGCTLCLACVSACPVQALQDDKDKPTLKFQEDLCVQCGLCAATCPEKVITLEPRIDFKAWAEPARVVKQEEPAHCIQCGKGFGVQSTINRIVAKLENKHWMFAGDMARRASLIRMCEDCRVEVVVNESFDPHENRPRPSPRTTEDYLRERRERGEDPLG